MAAHSNLYVYGLPAGINEMTLRQLFDNCGTVTSVKCYSEKRYGFVSFASPQEAQLAIDALDGQTIAGTTVNVKFADNPPAGGRGIPGAAYANAAVAAAASAESQPPPTDNLYTWNLPHGVDDNFLEKLFGQVGKVLSVKAIPEKRYGFVRFATVDEATLAINSINGFECEGTTIQVKYANPKGWGGCGGGPGYADAGYTATTGYGAGAYAAAGGADETFDAFAGYDGAIPDTAIPTSSVATLAATATTGAAGGGGATGCVVMPNGTVVDLSGMAGKSKRPPLAAPRQTGWGVQPTAAVAPVPGGLVGGDLYSAGGVGMAGMPGMPGMAKHMREESDPPPSDNLYVWNLPRGADDSFLEQLFGQIGQVMSVKCIMDKRYGFVRFATTEEATLALQSINNFECEGTTIRVKFANPRGWMGGPGGPPGPPAGGAYAGASEAAAQAAAAAAVIAATVTTKETAQDTVLLKGLPPGMTDDKLREIFDQYVVIKDCGVQNGSETESSAMVKAETAEQARWLVENLNGNIPQGLETPIQVAFAQDESSYGKFAAKGAAQRPGPYAGGIGGSLSQPTAAAAAAAMAQQGGHSNLYVWQLPHGCDDASLELLFSNIGTVISVKCNTERRYGFVKFASPEEAQLAIDSVNGLQVEGTTLRVQFANRDRGI